MIQDIIGWISGILSKRNETVVGGQPRSSQWRAVRDRFIKANNACAACGGIDDLEVHHVEPYHNDPAKELDEGNFIVLCRDCHFIFGHFKDWCSYNINVREDAATYRRKRDKIGRAHV